LSHYRSQGTPRSVAAAGRRGEVSSVFVSTQWQGVPASIVLFGFSSGERETDTLSTGRGWQQKYIAAGIEYKQGEASVLL